MDQTLGLAQTAQELKDTYDIGGGWVITGDQDKPGAELRGRPQLR
jgi:hypothetical protein